MLIEVNDHSDITGCLTPPEKGMHGNNNLNTINNTYRSNVMLRKSIAVKLSLLLVLLSFCPAMATEKTATLSGNAGLRLSVAQSATQLLDLLINHNEAFSLVIDRMYENNRISMPAQEFKQMLTDYLMEMSVLDIVDIAPGCLPPYTVSALVLLTYTPTVFVLFLDQMTNGDADCALMYGSWTVTGVCFALASWTQYRICAEQNAESPDQDTLAKLQNDLLTMGTGSLVSLGLGASFRLSCSEDLYLLEDFELFKNR